MDYVIYEPSFHSSVDSKLDQCHLLGNDSQHIVLRVFRYAFAQVNVSATWLPLSRVPGEVLDNIRLEKHRHNSPK